MPDRNRIREIPVRNIHPNPKNPRWEAGDVTGLAQSIEGEELLQSLLVIPAPQFGPNHFMIEDGYRRWVAGKERCETLPCIVRYPDPDEDLGIRAVITGLVTDVHKTHLSAMERAKAYGQLRDDYGMTQEQIGKRLGLTPSTISRYLSLLELSDKSKKAVRDGKVSVEQAVQAVQKHRAVTRKKNGQAPIDVGWEPDFFSRSHILAKKAEAMCDALEHSNRRRLGGIACGNCWNLVTRQDERKIVMAEYGLTVPMPITADGGVRVDGGVTGAQ